VCDKVSTEEHRNILQERCYLVISVCLFDLKKYYTSHISYSLDGKKREGLELFLEKIKNPAKDPIF